MNQGPVGADARAANTGGRQGLPATLGQDETPEPPVRLLSIRHIVRASARGVRHRCAPLC